ncbi:MAG: hypothetical protein AB1529_03390 [Candidatus Micrarchaeota archaeon]
MAGERDRRYLIIGVIGSLLTVFYFLALGLPVNLGTFQDMAILALYTMAWGFEALCIFCVAGRIMLPPLLRISEEDVRERLPYGISISFSLSLVISAIALWFTDSAAVALLVGIVLLEIALWLRNRARPQAPAWKPEWKNIGGTTDD